MKKSFKRSNWLKWTVAGVFGLMLAFNVMVSLDFDKDELLPSLTLVELGNQAYAQSEGGGGELFLEWDDCDQYYVLCFETVKKCRYTGSFPCYVWQQVPCEELCDVPRP
ncbi:hypothetical protein [Echinicola salinicaeni]|uniref:hypothetical protein n=1 Tax=Echinicola salinicaeni TaxID=2762757 RepID=UPI0016441D55|nr:hypothetical protein [Echinicola salinicaeni]